MHADEAKAHIRTANAAITEALQGLITFLATLRPGLRNEIMQILGDKIDRARLAKERLDTLLAEMDRAEGPKASDRESPGS